MRRKLSSYSFRLHFFYYLCAVKVITLKHNNEELRNTNGCYLVTQFSSNPNNRLILRQLQILRFFLKKDLCHHQEMLSNNKNRGLRHQTDLLHFQRLHISIIFLKRGTWSNTWLLPTIIVCSRARVRATLSLRSTG